MTAPSKMSKTELLDLVADQRRALALLVNMNPWLMPSRTCAFCGQTSHPTPDTEPDERSCAWWAAARLVPSGPGSRSIPATRSVLKAPDPEPLPDGLPPWPRCPDDGRCWHQCGQSCWRVRHAQPLGLDAWPPELRQAAAGDIDEPEPMTVADLLRAAAEEIAERAETIGLDDD